MIMVAVAVVVDVPLVVSSSSRARPVELDEGTPPALLEDEPTAEREP